MLAIAYFALFIGFIGYPFRVAVFVWWVYGWIVMAKVDHATGSAALAVLTLMAWWAGTTALTLRAFRLESTPWFKRIQPILEKSHLAGIFLGGLAAVGVSLAGGDLAVKMNHSDFLFLAVGYGVAFGLAAIVNTIAARRKRVTEVAA